MRNRVALSGHHYDIKERWFKGAGTPMLRAVNVMIGDTYPYEQRDPHDPKFSENVAVEYDKAMTRARSLLYEQRNLINDKWLPRFDIIKVAAPADNDATNELQQLLIDGCLDRLYENLVRDVYLLVAKQYVEPLETTLLRIYETEAKRLREFLQSYRAEYRDGVLPIAQEYE